MILAEKIIRLRKKLGWSQEDLAEKINVSRQSVSKWESAASIPDLNKIILLADLFGVSTDFLIKDELEETDTVGEDKEPGIFKVTLEEAVEYAEKKIEQSRYISIGVLISIYSVVPLIFLLGLSSGEGALIGSDAAVAFGLVSIFVAISIAISFFLRSNGFNSRFTRIDEGNFELSYGVRGVFSEKLEQMQGTYSIRLSIYISMIIVSAVPLVIVSVFGQSQTVVLLMLVLMLVMVGAAVYLLIPCVTENSAYNLILGEGDFSPVKRDQTRRSEKLGAFYWPLVTAIYIGWSLWTHAWGITWIIWPVAGIAFAGLVGLMGLFSKE
ncbi:helix-turn-helix domain-containing protein [Spirochaeta isovalerica]|uniref:Transcriptional regulator with XRE-family HTH domain n=1 Tax=Spirochaeta isovalerica TaxID=150 RepID=A0A841RJ93_9SPIO|nr:helix-turn-helix transcriptional regulator [Spirochaeta isovalerica]MBB6482578.1 transcriptional regulator with XRE-family HTH domain [Spirochaeta isovalerica]